MPLYGFNTALRRDPEVWLAVPPVMVAVGPPREGVADWNPTIVGSAELVSVELVLVELVLVELVSVEVVSVEVVSIEVVLVEVVSVKLVSVGPEGNERERVATPEPAQALLYASEIFRAP